jgi:hypothetical protein
VPEGDEQNFPLEFFAALAKNRFQHRSIAVQDFIRRYGWGQK